MDGELSGRAAAETLHGPLHQLPHLRADREVELQRRRMDCGAAADGELRARLDWRRAAEAQGGARAHRGGCGAAAAARRIPCVAQSERRAAMAVSAQAVAASQGP